MVLALLALGTLGCAPAGDSGGLADDPAGGDGIVFKGPMDVGGRVAVQGVDASGAEVGEPVDVEVDSELGTFSVAIGHSGIVLLRAEGPVLDESTGVTTGFSLPLMAYGELTDDVAALQVNVLGDLSRDRLQTLLGQGASFEDARAQAEAELIAALPVGHQVELHTAGAAIDPYGHGPEQAWIFAVSAVLARLGTTDALGDLADVLDTVRQDLAPDGALDASLVERIYQVELETDPDLAMLSLGATIVDFGDGEALPDIHPALDSDHDGVANDVDNCRYVANPDQADSLGLGFGDACDFRLEQISTVEQWGCGVMAGTGELACWQVVAEPTGGSPPHPDVYPTSPGTPWAEGDGLSGTYDRVAVGHIGVCGIQRGAGAVQCWQKEGDDFELAGSFVDVQVSDELVCALDGAGLLHCADWDGVALLEGAGPFSDFSPGPDGGVAGISATDGSLAWIDHAASPDRLPELPDGAFVQVSISQRAEGWGCAISAEDGALACFGEVQPPEDAPTGTGFVEVVAGAGIGCAVDGAGAMTCWRASDECPQTEDQPASARQLAADECQVCGLDDVGLGSCWPRFWWSKRAHVDRD